MVLDRAPDRYRLVFRFAACTGLRVSEIRALQWRHLELDGLDGPPKVMVRRQFYRGRIQPPKSRHGVRDVPLALDLADALRAARSRSKFAGATDLVFAGQGGLPFSDSNISSRVLKPLVSEAGAPWASWHTYRHTCASMLFAEGRNIKQVQRWLGHHSPDFTLRTYVHLLSDGVGEGLTLGAAPMPTGVAMDLAMFPAEGHVDRELVEAA
jgi:integrase